MKLLILGGTVFLGRHLVELAVQKGHQVTLFNRGLHNPDLFAPDQFSQVEKLHGDRDGCLDILARRSWDAVIDPSGYLPRVVRLSTELLARTVPHYTFISTISVYAAPYFANMDETAPLAEIEDVTTEQITSVTYGPLKALCEQVVRKAYSADALIIRPGLIVGPHDPSDRFTYWPARFLRGGRILAPGSPQRPIQFIDVRDLAKWILSMVEERKTGVYNVTGPEQPISFIDFLSVCQRLINSAASLEWVDEQFLLDNGVVPYTEMPLWLPEAESALEQISIDRALKASLSFSPLEKTIGDTLDWDSSRPPDVPRKNGMRPDREEELIRAYQIYQRRFIHGK